MTAKSRTLVILLGAVALILVSLALQLLAPGDKIDQTGAHGAHIVYSADHSILFTPNTCVTVRWQADHIQAVFFDDQPTVGQGIEQVCASTQMLPNLRVEFQDGTAQDYSLRVNFLVEQPSTWFLLSTALLLALLSLYPVLNRPSSSSRGGKKLPLGTRVFAAIGLLGTLISFFALVTEFGVRLYFGNFGTRDERDTYFSSRAAIAGRRDETIPLPFVESGLSPDLPGQNTLGYRGDEIQIPKPTGVYRIVALGDSSTFGNTVPYDQTYPYQLQTVLREQYGAKNIEVINAGVPHYTSWNMVTDLAFRIPELQPDLVIVYEAWNDAVALEISPECANARTPFLGLDPRRVLQAQGTELSPSAFYRLTAINLGWIPNPALSEITYVAPAIPCNPSTSSTPGEDLKANRPTNFARNLREMIALARVNGFQIMFMSWEYDQSRTYVPDYESAAVVEHNAIMAQVAQEEDILFYDYANRVTIDKSRWNDLLHMGRQGNLEQAQAIAKFLVDQQVIPPPAS